MTSLQSGNIERVPDKAWIENNSEEVTTIFPSDLTSLITTFHRQFEGQRKTLLQKRMTHQDLFDRGQVPRYQKNSKICLEDWKVAPIPSDLLSRKVEITGPVNDPKMVINMLSRNKEGERADTAMLDFEDSMRPLWKNVLNGYKNLTEAVKGTLTYENNYKLDPQDMALIMVRVRGLHLNENNIRVDGEPVSAGLLDLLVCAYHISQKLLDQGKTPKFYVPKCEHYLEARWWNKVFAAVEKALSLPHGTLKCTFLIETLPAAFQIEEILFELKDRVVALNVGRWDKIFSDIKVLREHPDRVTGDRSLIDMNCPWMENYAKRLIKICHSRGALAIGGMAAFTPGKSESLRQEQLAKVKKDKELESQWGHDGCWISHPYFIKEARSCFPKKNQLDRCLEEFDKFPDLLPSGKGKRTLKGLRKNIKVGIAYLKGWSEGKGCVAFDNLMEDLATLEISRAQIWQWVRHQALLEEGLTVTSDLVKRLFEEELDKILKEPKWDEKHKERFIHAKTRAQELFLLKKLPEFMEF
jgi:malate synthase